MEENKDADNRHDEPNNAVVENKPLTGIAIVGVNLLVLAGYTLLLRLFADGAGFIFDAFILFCHVLVCIGMALGKKSWMWFLSAVLVLAIGFSTCTMLSGL